MFYQALLLITLTLLSCGFQSLHAENSKFWIVGSYSLADRLIEKAQNGAVEYQAQGVPKIAVEYTLPSQFPIFVGLSWAAPRSSIQSTGMISSSYTQMGWNVFSVYGHTRLPLSENWYALGGASLSFFSVYGTGINTIHTSNSFSTDPQLGILGGVGMHLASDVFLETRLDFSFAKLTLSGGQNSGLSFPIYTQGFEICLGYNL